MIFLEQRPRQDVAQQKNYAKHLMDFDAAVNDTPGQVSGVGLQILDVARFQGLNVVVENLRCFRENLFSAHGGKQPSFVNAPRPFLPQRSTV